MAITPLPPRFLVGKSSTGVRFPQPFAEAHSTSPVSGTTTNETIRLADTFKSEDSSSSNLCQFQHHLRPGLPAKVTRIPRTPFAVRPITRASVSENELFYLHLRTT